MAELQNAHGWILIAEILAFFTIWFGGMLLAVLYVLGPLWRKKDD